MDIKRKKIKIITNVICILLSMALLIYAIVRHLGWTCIAAVIWIISGIVNIKDLH